MTVRRERVILDLEDNFTTGMLRAAGATKLLDHSLDSLGRSTVVTQRHMHQFVDDDSGGLRRLVKDAGIADTEFRDLSARTLMLADALSMLVPAAVPIAAVAIPAITGLASAFGFVTIATGSAILAFQGVGEALDAVNKAQLNPTEANLEAARLKMDQLSLSGQQLVRHLQDLRPALMDLRDVGATTMFPGINQGLDNLERVLPSLTRMAAEFGKATGDIFAAGTRSLGTARWTEFFDFLASNAEPTLKMVARTVGDLTHGLAELWMAFQPLNNDAGRIFADAADSFDRWASGLSRTQGFKDFVDYIHQTGPQVAATLKAVAEAVVQIVEAMGPLGGPSLKALEQLADVLSIIANSPLGPTLLASVAAMSALRMSARLLDGALRAGPVQAFKQLTSSMRTMSSVGIVAWGRTTDETMAYAAAAKSARGALLQLARPTALVAGLALASSGAADSMGLTNTASMALTGGLATGSPWGAAVGGAIGLMLDFKAANDQAASAIADVTGTLNQQTGAFTTETVKGLVKGLAEYSDVAEQAGYTTGQMAKAILKGGDSYDVMIAKLEAARKASIGTVDSSVSQADAFKAARDGNIANAEAYTELVGKVGDYRVALVNTQDEIVATTGEVDRATGAFYDQARAIRESTQAMKESRAEALRARNAEINWQSSILDARDALKENGKTLDIHTRKGQDNLSKLYAIAGAWNGLSQHAKNTPGRYKAAIRTFVDMAVAMGMDADAAKKLAENLMEIPTSRKFRLDTNVQAVQDQIQSFKNWLDGLNLDKVGHIRMINDGGMGPQVSAWTGGYTGRGGVLDPAGVVHRGELVIPQWLEQQDRSFLKSRYGGLLPGYADGGLVGSSAKGGQGPASDLARLGREARDSAKAIADERKQRQQAMKDKRQSLADSVAGHFTSDLFGESSPWAAGNDFMSTLEGDTHSARLFARQLHKLRKMGLNGDALAALAESGNIAAASQMVHMSRKQLRMYELAFNQRARAAREVGRYAGAAAYGGGGDGGGDGHTARAVREGNRKLDAIDDKLGRLPKDTADALKSSARGGARRSPRGGPRQ